MDLDEEYDIVAATEGDRERIAEFLRQTFYKYEPLNMSSGAPPNRPIDSMRSLQFLKEGTSLIAITRSGLIIGAALNGEWKQDKDSKIRHQTNFGHEAYTKIADFIDKVENSVDISKLTGADSAFCVYVLTVDPIASGRGVGKALMKHSRELAKAKGITAFVVMCTSFYSARIARGMGMECVYKLPYSEYKDEKGKQVFVPPHPHKEAEMFVQKLNNEM